jgi:hypothetical protein
VVTQWGLLRRTTQTSVEVSPGFVYTFRVRQPLRKEKSHMAIQAHLAELEKKHQALEEEINEALTHPSTDDLKVVELKRRKLQLKDEITRLRQDASVH